MKQKVLITGASGFLGYHLINAAIESGLDVYAGVRGKSNVEHLSALPLQNVVLDFNDVNALTEVILQHQFDFIVHAAGTTKAISAEEYNLVNTIYTSNLAKAAAAENSNCKKFVFISSLAASGPAKGLDNKVTEDMASPVTAYGRSKLAAEKALASIDIPSVILRPTAIYGPREKDLFLLANYLNKGLDAYIGRITQKLSFVHGKDVATASIRALLANGATGIFNIGDGKEYSRYDFADIIKKNLNKKAVRFHIPAFLVRAALALTENINRSKPAPVNREKLGELLAENWSCDIEKAKNQLGFSPVYDLDSGLKETIAWYKEHKWLK